MRSVFRIIVALAFVAVAYVAPTQAQYNGPCDYWYSQCTYGTYGQFNQMNAYCSGYTFNAEWQCANSTQGEYGGYCYTSNAASCGYPPSCQCIVDGQPVTPIGWDCTVTEFWVCDT